MAEKAFVYARENNTPPAARDDAYVQEVEGADNHGGGSILVEQVVRKMWKHPSLCKRFYDVSGGD